MLPGEVGDSGLQRADEMSHAISRTAAASRGGAEELPAGESDAHSEPGWHRSACIVMRSDASCDAPSTAEDFPWRSEPLQLCSEPTNKRGSGLCG